MTDKTDFAVSGYSGHNKENKGLVHTLEPKTGQSALATKFGQAMELIVGEFHDAGLHPSDMKPALDWWAKWSREATAASNRQ